jgi:hypothetical protein
MKMPFGRYQGVELNEIPEPYLRWLRSQPWVGGWLIRAVDGVLGDVARWPDEEEVEELASFSVLESGNVGQTILNCDGEVIAWTTDAWVALVICKLLNENEELLYKREEKHNETHA